MSAHKDTVERYFEGFRRSDHDAVLECLSDDVTWELPGYKHLAGKDAFDKEIEGADFVGSPTLAVDRLVEEDGTVVAIGEGAGTHAGGAAHRFAFCTVFTFRGDAISRVESYVTPLS